MGKRLLGLGLILALVVPGAANALLIDRGGDIRLVGDSGHLVLFLRGCRGSLPPAPARRAG